MMISGRVGVQLGLFLGASLLTITEIDVDDDYDNDDDDDDSDDDNDDDDDFRQSGRPAGTVSGRQSADHHRAGRAPPVPSVGRHQASPVSAMVLH